MTTTINDIENRFKEVTCLTHLDLSTPHFTKSDNQQQKTTKQEYKDFGFVTTPLWLVDEMVESQMDNLTLDSKTCDACCGCGQFSIRLMRKLYLSLINKGEVDEEKANLVIIHHWLKKNHYFTEFQFSNVAKLIYIFGVDINVYIGDSLNIKYASDEDKGLLIFNSKLNKWVNLPDKIMPYIVNLKDDLNGLIQLFTSLEKKIV